MVKTDGCYLIVQMNRLTFDDYSYHAWTTAFYLDEEPGEQLRIIHSWFNEELGELLTDDTHPAELTAKLWGLDVEQDISQKLNKDKLSEAGDILYFISSAGLLRNIPMRDIANEAIQRYTGSEPIGRDETIDDFDEILTGRMAERVPENYKPNYHTWKLWDFAPFEDGLHILLRDPEYSKGPLQLIPDGRYALERLLSTLGRFMPPEVSTQEEFIASAGLALGGLSIVLGARFDASLADAARNNMQKRERRQMMGALKAGADEERSRKIGEERITISDEQSTANNLLNAPLPEFPR
jgi:hypothetical protein